MKFDWRASAFAAGAAFLLSILAGIISGVPFGALMLRAVLGAVVFAAGAAGVSVLIDRFLPDLKQSLANPGARKEAAPSGGRVDIVVEDEPFGGASGGFELEETHDGADELSAATGPMRAPASFDDEDADEVGELESAEDDADDHEPTPDAAEDGDAAGEFTPGLAAERVHTVAEDGHAEARGARAPGGVTEAMPEVASAGSLPDIEGFSGSFSEPGGGAQVEEEPTSGSSDDASTMARAIRTVLKREQ